MPALKVHNPSEQDQQVVIQVLVPRLSTNWNSWMHYCGTLENSVPPSKESNAYSWGGSSSCMLIPIPRFFCTSMIHYIPFSGKYWNIHHTESPDLSPWDTLWVWPLEGSTRGLEIQVRQWCQGPGGTVVQQEPRDFFTEAIHSLVCQRDACLKVHGAIFNNLYSFTRWGSSVGIVSGYRQDDQVIDVRSLAEAKRFFL
jgi:hypothetical protein